jgi:nanoRNase/pAp phosphatase (c-di-AMP/oligoRNAs hydrolase)
MKMNSLDEVIMNIQNKHVFIQTHNFPDPDAVASAYGLQRLLLTREITSTISYKGRIDSTITAKMVKLLGIEIFEMEEITDMSEDAEIILVDSQKGNSNIISMPGSEILCIDHHPVYGKADYKYSDIRPDVGACASIIASYFYENNIALDTKTATALLYGIKIDTANMTRGVGALDLEMFYKIYRMADHQMIRKLDTSVLKIADLESYAKAFQSMVTKDNVCFANAGVNCQESLIASISDFILDLDGIDLVVVYSLRDDGIKLSVRSLSSQYNAGKVTNAALQGIGNGGGHEHMAGGFVPFGKNKENQSEKVEYWLLRIQQRFLDRIRGAQGRD